MVFELQDLQPKTIFFAARCKSVRMRVSTSESYPQLLPQAKEFKFLGVLLTSDGKMEHEMDRRFGAASAVLRVLLPTFVVKREPCQKAKPLDLPVYLRSHPHVWLRAVGSDR